MSNKVGFYRARDKHRSIPRSNVSSVPLIRSPEMLKCNERRRPRSACVCKTIDREHITQKQTCPALQYVENSDTFEWVRMR